MAEDAPPSVFENRLRGWQASLDFTKSVLIVGLVLTFVLYPRALWVMLDRAGFSLNEVEFFGAKLTKTSQTAVDLDAALKQALLDNQSLQAKLVSTEASLNEASKCLTDLESLKSCAKNPALIKQLKLDEAVLSQSRQFATSSAAAANATLRTNAAVLQESYARVSSRPTSWGIIFGGDASRRDAEDEIAKAKDAPNLAIYVKQRSHRSVAVFDSREAADEWLPRLKKINAGAYVVALNRWCQDPRERDRTPRYVLIECQGS
jgi:hypothetical protein